ncbi:MAG: GNAT family N-acetyltransferase [Alphaproteobacteria bacterium]|nr:GNAT family N-acetyltransferase [Alphaproteobacteria bacterium]
MIEPAPGARDRAAAPTAPIAPPPEGGATVLVPMRPCDIPAVSAMHIASLRALSITTYSAAEIEAYATTMATPDYAEDLARSDIHMAVATEAVAPGAGNGDGRGAAAQPWGTAGWIAHEDAPGTARIRKVFTHPLLARRGIARRLVAAAEARARAAGFPRLIARVHLNALPFWLAIGYSITGPAEMEVAGGVRLRMMWMARPD